LPEQGEPEVEMPFRHFGIYSVHRSKRLLCLGKPSRSKFLKAAIEYRSPILSRCGRYKK
jgi:hypothetical protein